MDTQNELRIAKCGVLAELTGKQLVVGAKQLRKAIRAGRVKKAFLAQNADPGITGPAAALCQQKGIEFRWVSSMKELGQACGIEVGTATAAIVD